MQQNGKKWIFPSNDLETIILNNKSKEQWSRKMFKVK